MLLNNQLFLDFYNTFIGKQIKHYNKYSIISVGYTYILTVGYTYIISVGYTYILSVGYTYKVEQWAMTSDCSFKMVWINSSRLLLAAAINGWC